MSLLGTPVYANPTTPIWLSSQGGETDEIIATSGFTQRPASGTAAGFRFEDASGNTTYRLASFPTTQNIIQSSLPIVFSQIGTGQGNTSLQTSAFGANTDLLRVGGTVRPNVFDTPDSGGNRALRITGGAPGIGYIQGSTIRFTQLDATTGNTALVTSTAGTNADLLTVGGTVDAQALKLANTGGAATVGSGTLSSGTVTISTTASDVNSYILVSRTNLAGVPPQDTGFLRVSNKSANSFTVVSVDSSGNQLVTDDSSFDWVILNPA